MITLQNLTKKYDAFEALRGVSVKIEFGKVHALVGENGAGKSTLLRILSGIEQPTSGQILVHDEPLHLGSPATAMAAGISMIHQELNLIDELSVSQNIFLGREIRSGFRLDQATMDAESASLLKRVGSDISVNTIVGTLSIAQKQLVEIAKSLSFRPRVLIMDEPTAVLSAHECSSLFSLIKELQAEGIAIVYVSHHLSEVELLADQVTVLRDGAMVSQFSKGEFNANALAAAMVGREISDLFPKRLNPISAEKALEVAGLKTRKVGPVSFEVRAGEVFGLGGLVGSGRTEVGEALFGLDPWLEGELKVEGKPVSGGNCARALSAGIAYVSEDRKGAGLHVDLNAEENVLMPSLSEFAKPILDLAAVRQMCSSWVQNLGIKVRGPWQTVRELSGGNQQKIALAKWLQTHPKVLVLDEPTRGIDVNAKHEAYELIRKLTHDGLAVILISSEMPELVGLCDRIAVMRNGQIVGLLEAPMITEQNIMRLAAGLADEAA